MSHMIIEWLRHEPQDIRDWIDLLKVLVSFCALMTLLGFVLLGKNPAAAMYERSKTVVENSPFGAAWKFMLFVLGEEAFYRFGGLFIAVYLFPEDLYAVLMCAAGISIAFGFLPPHNVMPLGVRVIVACGGFFLSLLYLKCGGLNGDYPKALLVSTTAHLVPSSIFSLAFAYYRR